MRNEAINRRKALQQRIFYPENNIVLSRTVLWISQHPARHIFYTANQMQFFMATEKNRKGEQYFHFLSSFVECFYQWQKHMLKVLNGYSFPTANRPINFWSVFSPTLVVNVPHNTSVHGSVQQTWITMGGIIVWFMSDKPLWCSVLKKVISFSF